MNQFFRFSINFHHFLCRFLVNIRDEKTLEVKKGCSVWDMGYKIGLNGVDNAALWFDKVRVPRLNLLNATSYIDENGVFSSKV
jgi:acyl-CoA oxidase